MPCVIMGGIKRFWLSCLIGAFGFLTPRYCWVVWLSVLSTLSVIWGYSRNASCALI